MVAPALPADGIFPPRGAAWPVRSSRSVSQPEHPAKRRVVSGADLFPTHMRRPTMLRTFATVTAVSALMLSGALAQSTQPGDSPAMSPPAATAPAPSAQPAAPKGDMSKVQIINAQ